MLRSTQLRLAVGLFAAGIISLTAASAWAFSQTMVSPGGGYSTLTDPDNKTSDPDNHNSAQGVRPLGSSGPTLQFGVQQGPWSSFGSGSGHGPTPDPYFRPLNGN
jgi:hypothetical protein